jgi:acetate kinase
MIILALNCGSSSVKYKLYDWKKRESLTAGVIERIGIEGGPPNHREALSQVISELCFD